MCRKSDEIMQYSKLWGAPRHNWSAVLEPPYWHLSAKHAASRVTFEAELRFQAVSDVLGYAEAEWPAMQQHHVIRPSEQ